MADTEVDDQKKMKSANWIFTMFDCDESRRKRLENIPEYVKFLAYGDEVTKDGLKHYQGYIITWNPVRFSQFDSWLGNCYRTVMKGRLMDNEKYCSKQSELKKIGTEPMQGRRTDLLGVKRALDKLESGKNIMDLARDESHFEHVVKYERSLDKYLQNKRFRDMQIDRDAKEVIWLYGAAGSGKTRYVYDREPLVYSVPAGNKYKWKAGYSGEEAVLYDNLDFDNKPIYSEFLKEIDRYPIQCETKGGFVAWKPKRIYITSIHTPMALYGDENNRGEEIKRRITSTMSLPFAAGAAAAVVPP